MMTIKKIKKTNKNFKRQVLKEKTAVFSQITRYFPVDVNKVLTNEKFCTQNIPKFLRFFQHTA